VYAANKDIYVHWWIQNKDSPSTYVLYILLCHTELDFIIKIVPTPLLYKILLLQYRIKIKNKDSPSNYSRLWLLISTNLIV
jgi:hypothetical protein